MPIMVIEDAYNGYRCLLLCVMRDIASYIKSIYARYASLTAHISLYSMRYPALYTRGY